MNEGLKIAVDWNNRKQIPDLPPSEILDKVSSTILEMTIENGKMARTLHEVLYRIMYKEDVLPEDISFLRNVIIDNLGSNNACPVAEKKHENGGANPHRNDC